ncbi:MAG: hypothetical protein KJO46_03930 [Gammaproteobacteria bacterium]|nr:hypothetical protein [Gammaproteobacteria bacterium]
MNGEDDDIIDGNDTDDDDDLDDLDEMDSDNIGDLSVELNIEELTAKLAASDSEDVHRRAEIRRRLEELRELREQELDSTFNFKFDDDD